MKKKLTWARKVIQAVRKHSSKRSSDTVNAMTYYYKVLLHLKHRTHSTNNFLKLFSSYLCIL